MEQGLKNNMRVKLIKINQLMLARGSSIQIKIIGGGR